MRIGIDALPLQAKQAGVARYLLNILANMLELDPTLEAVLYGNQTVDCALPPGRWRIRVGARRGVRTRTQVWLHNELPKWLAEDGIDVFWGQNGTMPLRLKRPCARILTIHDLTPFVAGSSMRFKPWLQSRVLLRATSSAADRVIADSEATARAVRSHLGVSEDRLRVVPAGCDPGFKRVAKDAAWSDVTRRFGIERRPFLLAVGTIEPRKAYPVLLDALAGIPGAPQLVIVGAEGWRCGEIMDAIRDSEKSGAVRYLGRLSDSELVSLYNTATLLVCPSLYEGFGLPVLEAMKCGCPVLCSWSSSLPEVGGTAALYFRNLSVEDLRTKLELLLSNQGMRQGMVTRGLVQSAGFSFRNAARQILGIARDAVPG